MRTNETCVSIVLAGFGGIVGEVDVYGPEGGDNENGDGAR
jgi:hypothetical protein